MNKKFRRFFFYFIVIKFKVRHYAHIYLRMTAWNSLRNIYTFRKQKKQLCKLYKINAPYTKYHLWIVCSCRSSEINWYWVWLKDKIVFSSGWSTCRIGKELVYKQMQSRKLTSKDTYLSAMNLFLNLLLHNTDTPHAASVLRYDKFIRESKDILLAK